MTRQVKAPEAEVLRWRRCAAARGLAFNKWARWALNEQADLEEALGRLESAEAAVRSGRVDSGKAGVV